MFSITILFLIIGVVWALAYFSVPLLAWSSGLILLMFAATYYGMLGWMSWIAWPIMLGFLAVLTLPFLRKRLISNYIFNWFCKKLPAMSDTERAAIEAGTTWWESQVFQGNPNWKILFSGSSPSLSVEEQRFMNEKVIPLCDKLDDWEICHEKSNLPEEIWSYLKDNKFFSLIIPKQYGGLEFSAYAHSCIVTKIATRSIAAAVTVMVPNSLGPAELLIAYGTTRQKNYYLPRLAGGKEIPCFALTGPEAGSDAGSIPDQGIVCKGQHNGEEVLGIRLNFDKRYITLAPCATVMGLAFKLFDPDKLIGNQESIGITVCLIPTDHPGIEIGSRHFPLNIAFLNGPIRGTDVFIPMEFVIGGQPMIGQGWRMLMECLSAGRGISLPALGTGAGALSYTMTGAYAAIRKQFNLPIGEFEGIQEVLAQIAGNALKLEATRQFTAQGVDVVHKPSVASAIAKYHMTEMARTVINQAMDIHAGKGIILGPMNYLGRIYQALPICITVEGANILTRTLMIFGQGAIRCHPYVKSLMDAVSLHDQDPDQALTLFDKTLIRYVGFFATNKARAFARGLTCGFLIFSVPQSYRRQLQILTWFSSGLALCSDIAMMVLGGNLKRKETLSGRLGDVLSHLYIASALLKFAQQHEKNLPLQNLTKWCLTDLIYQMQENFMEFFKNFPNKWIGVMMRFAVFPFGKIFNKPSDRFDQLVAKDVLEDTELRALFKQVCYIGDRLDDPTGIVENAFKKLNAVQPLLGAIIKGVKEKTVPKDATLTEQIHHAFDKGIIDEQGYQNLLEYDALRQKVINVDEFSSKTQLGSQSRWSQKQVTIQVG